MKQILTPVTAGLVLAVALIITVLNWRIGLTSDEVIASRKNHDASVCLIAVLHEISAASGKPPAAQHAAFDSIFREQWLIDNCGLTSDEARRVLAAS